MSDSVSIVTSPQNPAPQTSGSATAPATPPAAESFQAQAAQNQNANTNPPASTASASDSNTPISPRIVFDPFAGPITEVLSANGQIQAQFPSVAVVAYLRAGLTSSGLPKPTTDPVPQTEANTNTGTNGSDKGSVVA